MLFGTSSFIFSFLVAPLINIPLHSTWHGITFIFTISSQPFSRVGATSLEEAEALMNRQWDPAAPSGGGGSSEASGRLLPKSVREAEARQKMEQLEVWAKGFFLDECREIC